MNFRILGTGSCLPKRTVTNEELTKFLDTSDEWIHTRTGIRSRHIMTEGETVTTLAAQASRRAMEMAGISADELDYILCPTIGADYISPGLSSTVEEALGADCPTLDVNGACSGFIYALDIAGALFQAGKVKKMLVVSGEGLSRIADWNDRATCVLFGDGAGAVVLGEGDSLLSTRLGCTGRSAPLYIPYYSGNCPVGGEKSYIHGLKMDGKEVYKFAVSAIEAELCAVMKQAGVSQQEVAQVLLHQANRRIIEAAAKKLEIPLARYGINIDRVGNTSSASIPILLDEYNRAGRLHSGDIILMCGFGAGLTTGAAALRWAETR